MTSKAPFMESLIIIKLAFQDDRCTNQAQLFINGVRNIPASEDVARRINNAEVFSQYRN
jgi:hypothetical protein